MMTLPVPPVTSGERDVTNALKAIASMEDEPITLADACTLYPRAKLKVSTLRAEAGRGRLDIFRIGRRDYTTPAAMIEMVRRCRDEDCRRASTSIRQDASGSSETEKRASAQAALSQAVQVLRSSSPNTSARSTSLRSAPTH